MHPTHDSIESQDVLDASRFHINMNGVDFALPDNDSLLVLLCFLQKHTLDPMFEDYGNFQVPCRAAGKGEFDADTCEYAYVDLGPIYANAPSAVRFFGNFIDVYHPFSIDTDDPQLIGVLLNAIRKNQERAEYLDARAELRQPAISSVQH
jgi:hypothetical protein